MADFAHLRLMANRSHHVLVVDDVWSDVGVGVVWDSMVRYSYGAAIGLTQLQAPAL